MVQVKLVAVLISFVILGLVLPSHGAPPVEQKVRKYRIRSNNSNREVQKDLGIATASATFFQHDGNQTIIKTTEISTTNENMNGIVWSFLSGKKMRQFMRDVFIGSQSELITANYPEECSYLRIPEEYLPKGNNATINYNKVDGKCKNPPISFGHYVGYGIGSFFGTSGESGEIQNDVINNRISGSDITSNAARFKNFVKSLIWKMVNTED